jgi:hypothetical protein
MSPFSGRGFVSVFRCKKIVSVSIFREKGGVNDSVPIVRFMERVQDCLHLPVERVSDSVRVIR